MIGSNIFDPKTEMDSIFSHHGSSPNGDFGSDFNLRNFSGHLLRIEIIGGPSDSKSHGEGCTRILISSHRLCIPDPLAYFKANFKRGLDQFQPRSITVGGISVPSKVLIDSGVDELVSGMAVLQDISLLDAEALFGRFRRSGHEVTLGMALLLKTNRGWIRCPVSNTPAAEKLRGHRIQYPFAFVGAWAIAPLSFFPGSSILSLDFDLDLVVFMLVHSC
ncbi:hypothetical protein F2Q68_00034073 [Brassica cretica]|uniref:Uncharacterized protein n=1 Tax=Brassica cretica TaxID=69181 RepID=A0A8S9H559_BRACR|nr:hypothetical protein F2Q68_00034073 [Brassica cretica]